jgi:hypothetical protein
LHAGADQIRFRYVDASRRKDTPNMNSFLQCVLHGLGVHCGRYCHKSSGLSRNRIFEIVSLI